MYLSSPKDYSLHSSQYPKSSSVNSETSFTAVPPQAFTILSMFLLLALLKAMIPSLANKSKQTGSIPF